MNEHPVSHHFTVDPASLTGKLLAAHVDDESPIAISVGSSELLAVFDTPAQLDAAMREAKAPAYKIKRIVNGHEFVDSCFRAGIRVALNLRMVEGLSRWTEVKPEMEERKVGPPKTIKKNRLNGKLYATHFDDGPIAVRIENGSVLLPIYDTPGQVAEAMSLIQATDYKIKQIADGIDFSNWCFARQIRLAYNLRKINGKTVWDEIKKD